MMFFTKNCLLGRQIDANPRATHSFPGFIDPGIVYAGTFQRVTGQLYINFTNNTHINVDGSWDGNDTFQVGDRVQFFFNIPNRPACYFVFKCIKAVTGASGLRNHGSPMPDGSDSYPADTWQLDMLQLGAYGLFDTLPAYPQWWPTVPTWSGGGPWNAGGDQYTKFRVTTTISGDSPTINGTYVREKEIQNIFTADQVLNVNDYGPPEPPVAVMPYLWPNFPTSFWQLFDGSRVASPYAFVTIQVSATSVYVKMIKALAEVGVSQDLFNVVEHLLEVEDSMTYDPAEEVAALLQTTPWQYVKWNQGCKLSFDPIDNHLIRTFYPLRPQPAQLVIGGTNGIKFCNAQSVRAGYSVSKAQVQICVPFCIATVKRQGSNVTTVCINHPNRPFGLIDLAPPDDDGVSSLIEQKIMPNFVNPGDPVAYCQLGGSGNL